MAAFTCLKTGLQKRYYACPEGKLRLRVSQSLKQRLVVTPFRGDLSKLQSWKGPCRLKSLQMTKGQAESKRSCWDTQKRVWGIRWEIRVRSYNLRDLMFPSIDVLIHTIFLSYSIENRDCGQESQAGKRNCIRRTTLVLRERGLGLRSPLWGTCRLPHSLLPPFLLLSINHGIVL